MTSRRFAFQTRSQVEILDDGYKWRKYGQKAVSRCRRPPPYCHRRESVASTEPTVEPLATLSAALESRPSRSSRRAAAATTCARSVSVVVCPIHRRPAASATSSKAAPSVSVVVRTRNQPAVRRFTA
ncbi:putative WRKY transcription factor 75 isoform X2 [Cucumis melo var. makuwa]|uniref:WRKY transcription factor 75 isoform X2 n=1 Tax=Cucumis melo var. makuwa TaxID=1194695 RepID=A0A5D3DUG7_CUCMM|nr:putative WRKY transcription factor 75 isoform X2 [Cucumis melo var. makuwa]TYK27138.1 putative WRKY transcription factor 75 isoform X2 [Cucumis melo var. makuwa]